MDYSSVIEEILHQKIRPNEKGEARVSCPFHEDVVPSASINVYTGLFHCFSCGASYNLPQLLNVLNKKKFPTIKDAKIFLINNYSSKRLLELVNRAEEYHHYLLEHPELLNNFSKKRMLSVDIIKKKGIGYNPKNKYYSIPIFDDIGNLHGIKYYSFNKKPKMFWEKDDALVNTNYLYPIESVLNELSQVILVEGELDALTLIDRGFNAVSFTSGSSSFNDNLKNYFRKKNIIIFYDNDKPGEKGSLMVAKKLKNIASSIKIFDWSIIEAEESMDITDLFRNKIINEESLIRSFANLKYFVSNLEKIDFDSVFNINNINKDFSLETFVIGKEMTPFEFPMKIFIRCNKTIKNLKRCKECSLKDKGILININREKIFDFIQVDSKIIKNRILNLRGIKNCPFAILEKREKSFITHMWGIAPPNFKEGKTANTEKEFYYIGKQELPINTQFIFKTKIVTNDRNQRNKLIVWDETESSPDFLNYNFDKNSINRLKQFQAEDNKDKIIKKLLEIADLLSNVTHIYGRPYLHLFYYLIWHSALSFKAFNEDINRGWLQGLLIGDQRTGKTRAAKKLINFFGLGDFVSSEGASIVGLIGGLDKMPGEGSFILKWGKIPQNDKRLLVLDEVGELRPDMIGKLSQIRSEGIAQITKIEGQSTPARTRLIMITNPKAGRPLNSYLYPIEVIKEVISKPEDIARFDLAYAVEIEDVSPELINSIRKSYKVSKEVKQAYRESVIWAWSRHKNQIIITDEAQEAILKEALKLGSFYDSNFVPLIQSSNIRIKLARISVAVASSIMSTNDFNQLIVTRSHVEAASYLIEKFNKKLGYYQFSLDRKKKLEEIKKNKENILEVLRQFEHASEYIYDTPEFFFKELSTNLGFFDVETAQLKIILAKYHLVTRNSNGSYSKTNILTSLIKEAIG